MNVGITGHRNLGTKPEESWTSTALRLAVTEYEVTRGITCLAGGADQLFAEILLERRIPYIAVVPSANYEKSFESHSQSIRYETLLRCAQRSIFLPYPNPSTTAFLDAGKRVVDLSDLIFAVWNGNQANGLGGTADIVEYATSKSKTIVQFNPIIREVKLK